MSAEAALTDRDKMKIAQSIHNETLGVMAAIDRIEQAVLQSPEMQALRKDAERYRHIRPGDALVWCSCGNDLLTGKCLDAEIDASIDVHGDEHGEQKP